MAQGTSRCHWRLGGASQRPLAPVQRDDTSAPLMAGIQRATDPLRTLRILGLPLLRQYAFFSCVCADLSLLYVKVPQPVVPLCGGHKKLTSNSSKQESVKNYSMWYAQVRGGSLLRGLDRGHVMHILACLHHSAAMASIVRGSVAMSPASPRLPHSTPPSVRARNTCPDPF